MEPAVHGWEHSSTTTSSRGSSTDRNRARRFQVGAPSSTRNGLTTPSLSRNEARCLQAGAHLSMSPTRWGNSTAMEPPFIGGSTAWRRGHLRTPIPLQWSRRIQTEARVTDAVGCLLSDITQWSPSFTGGSTTSSESRSTPCSSRRNGARRLPAGAQCTR